MAALFTVKKLDLETPEFLFLEMRGDDEALNVVHFESRDPADIHYNVLRTGEGLSIVEVRYYELDTVKKVLLAQGGEWIHSK